MKREDTNVVNEAELYEFTQADNAHGAIFVGRREG